jgi:hypothetical protein
MFESALAGPIITTAVLSLIASPLLWFGGRNLWNASASIRWPVAEGKIRTSEIREFLSGTSGDRNRTRNYTPSILFEYTVGGQQYSGRTVYRGQAAGDADATEAEVLHARYPEGATVEVHYEPRNPANSLLEPGIESDVFWLPGLGLAFLLPCVIYWVTFWMWGPLFEWPFMPGELLAVGLCVAGLAMLVSGTQNLKLGWESKVWPTVSGVVVSSPFESENRSPSLIYEYEVAGRKYRGGLLQFGGLSLSNYAKDEAFVRRYAVGNAVPVAYRPAAPSISVLEPGVHSDAWWIPSIGMFLLLAGLALAIFAIPAMTRFDFVRPFPEQWPQK